MTPNMAMSQSPGPANMSPYMTKKDFVGGIWLRTCRWEMLSRGPLRTGRRRAELVVGVTEEQRLK